MSHQRFGWARVSGPFFRLDERLQMMVLGVFVGCCAGLASVVLNRSLVAFADWRHPLRHLWWAFIIPGIGALLSSLFLEKVVNEGAGHGVPEVVYSVISRGGLLRARSSFSRLVSSCLTIGCGGSAGPEAPVVMSGGAIGSTIARTFLLNERQRIVLVGCGAAGAIAGIFNAPIAGMVFSLEVILGEWNRVSIIPIALAAVAGTEVSRILQGNQIPFSHEPFQISLVDIVASVGLAIVAAAASILLTRMLRLSRNVWQKLPLADWWRAFAGGCAVGAIGLFAPIVMGEGYHVVREITSGQFHLGLALVAAAVIGKMVATSLTLGSGGSGGIFAPCLMIGSLLGLGYHRLLETLSPPDTFVAVGCFALLGMAGLISGMLQAPLTAIFLIVEITGGYGFILPLIVVAVVSATVCNHIEPASFYLRELGSADGQLPRPGTDARVLADLKVSELLESDCVVSYQNMRLSEFVLVVKRSHRNHFPVLDNETGLFVGMIHLDDTRQYLFSPELHDMIIIEEIMDSNPETVDPDDDLNHVLERMDRLHVFSLPVVAESQFIGMISKATLLDQYRKELIVQTSQG